MFLIFGEEFFFYIALIFFHSKRMKILRGQTQFSKKQNRKLQLQANTKKMMKKKIVPLAFLCKNKIKISKSKKEVVK
jgi:hypothetical protein